MDRFRIVVTDMLADDLAPERAVFGDRAELVAAKAATEADLFGPIEDADGLLVYLASITPVSIERMPRCKAIVRCGVGFDNIDGAFARSRGIPVANVPDYGTEEVAETALGLMLALTRGLHITNGRMQRGAAAWNYREAGTIHRLRGRTFGVLGLGRIGTAAAIRAKTLGMDVVFHDPLVADGLDKALGLKRIENFDEFLGRCHVLSVHTPLTPPTRNIIDGAAIAKLPRGSFLINTARGACVDTDAIPAAILSGQLAGAGIDVLKQEPPSDDDPLVKAWRDPEHPAYDRVILNPHGAFYSEEGLHDLRTKGAQTCLKLLTGEACRNVVN